MQIAIIGLGLIGGSVGMALKQANWKQAKIVGYVRRPELVPVAINLGIVDKVEHSLRDTVKGADLVIIATPVLTVREILAEIAPYLSAGCIVTDTASTKLQVMCWAEELLPSRVNFVGGHPMAGSEKSGIEVAEASLFHKCIYCLTPALRAKTTAVETMTDMVRSLGASPLIIDAQEHDNLVAGISHLPLLLSVALVSVTTQNPSWGTMSRLASSGYRDLTRLASGNPEVNAHICLSNQTAIVSWIDGFIEELKRLRNLVADGSSEIEMALALASEVRQKWLENRP